MRDRLEEGADGINTSAESENPDARSSGEASCPRRGVLSEARQATLDDEWLQWKKIKNKCIADGGSILKITGIPNCKSRAALCEFLSLIDI